MLGLIGLIGAWGLYACAPSKPEPVKTVTIADGEIDPGQLGQGLSPGIRLLAQNQRSQAGRQEQIQERL